MSYELFLSRDYLVFSSAHFVIGENFFEPLHGHNYKLQINVYGQQGQDNMVINFLSIKKILAPLIDLLDHRVLIATENKHIEILEKGEQVIINIPRLNKEYEFPRTDVALLPIENTTVEEMSHYFVNELIKNEELKQENIERITVTVNEYEGQGVTVELLPDLKKRKQS
ncbi:hypothetical protein ES705_31758 [subsurface metagenome]|jgi:6-pyruvoyltetrahydropterin/6-carboxytetrahydropterin synthase